MSDRQVEVTFTHEFISGDCEEAENEIQQLRIDRDAQAARADLAERRERELRLVATCCRASIGTLRANVEHIQESLVALDQQLIDALAATVQAEPRADDLSEAYAEALQEIVRRIQDGDDAAIVETVLCIARQTLIQPLVDEPRAGQPPQTEGVS